MSLKINDKEVTTNEFVRTIICSVLEDTQNNFDEYAKIYCKDFDKIKEDDRVKMEQWKTKIFNRLNRTMKREELIDNE